MSSVEALAPETDQPWSRLDKRMLLVHPVTEVVKFIPVLIGSVILGTSSGNHVWSIIPLALIVGFALTRWFTTTYRVGPTHVELRTGLVQRKKLAVPRSRIRSVDIEADLLHRLLGLAVLAIGTGQQADSGEKFKLDALDARLVPDLRTALLAHTGAAPQGVAGQPVPDDAAVTETKDAQPGREIAHWNPGWVRYAPLSLTGFAIIAPIVGLAFQYGVGQVLFRSDAVQRVENGGAALIAIGTAGLLVVIVLIVSLAACARYLTTYFGLRVIDDGRTLHLRHGLFTTRQITLDLARFRGATVNEPLLLRLAGAAELEAIMVGASPRQKILPQAPRTAIEHTLSHLLAPDEFQDKAIAPPAGPTPGSAPLIPHGPIARRRRYTRTLAPIAVAALVMLGFSVAGAGFSPWWYVLPVVLVPIAIALAEDRYRGLGHTVLPETPTSPAWLIARSGSLGRDRDCLEAPGVIGWTVRQSFFQRRAGVATVVAAAAAGKKRYHVLDLPIEEAWALIDSVTPGQLGQR
ncbi:PH domain-containing protein [Nocardia colli]|uniref:PH domain-containing protein n=2 Tax=Nocardia colli TaxID=2545717 RepID=A0A5N0EFE7_9NOCA|nr:PH domain-containing protein [Nocardia colli]KAA8888138.1 PH domain-containing protein [Nocardia colli]